MAGTQAPQLKGRCWLTARALRALGHDVPADINDVEAVRLTTKETS